jgi:hypothetical protein
MHCNLRSCFATRRRHAPRAPARTRHSEPPPGRAEPKAESLPTSSVPGWRARPRRGVGPSGAARLADPRGQGAAASAPQPGPRPRLRVGSRQRQTGGGRFFRAYAFRVSEPTGSPRQTVAAECPSRAPGSPSRQKAAAGRGSGIPWRPQLPPPRRRRLSPGSVSGGPIRGPGERGARRSEPAGNSGW